MENLREIKYKYKFGLSRVLNIENDFFWYFVVWKWGCLKKIYYLDLEFFRVWFFKLLIFGLSLFILDLKNLMYFFLKRLLNYICLNVFVKGI